GLGRAGGRSPTVRRAGIGNVSSTGAGRYRYPRGVRVWCASLSTCAIEISPVVSHLSTRSGLTPILAARISRGSPARSLAHRRTFGCNWISRRRWLTVVVPSFPDAPTDGVRLGGGWSSTVYLRPPTPSLLRSSCCKSY